MIRRRFTLKRVDPWSVLKFGFVVNIALMLVAMLGFWILWIVIGRLGLVDQFCDSVGSIVLDLQECSLNGGNIFRTLLFLGLLGVVVQTGIMVFGAFLYNLIADLTGGLGFTFLDESGDAVREGRATSGSTTGTATTAAAAGTAASVPSGSSTSPRSAGSRTGGPPDQSSAAREPTPDGPPERPGRPADPASPSTSTSGSGSTSDSASPSRDSGSTPGGSGTTGSSDTRGSGTGGSDRPGSSGSLWGDPTRSTDRP